MITLKEFVAAVQTFETINLEELIGLAGSGAQLIEFLSDDDIFDPDFGVMLDLQQDENDSNCVYDGAIVFADNEWQYVGRNDYSGGTGNRSKYLTLSSQFNVI